MFRVVTFAIIATCVLIGGAISKEMIAEMIAEPSILIKHKKIYTYTYLYDEVLNGKINSIVSSLVLGETNKSMAEDVHMSYGYFNDKETSKITLFFVYRW